MEYYELKMDLKNCNVFWVYIKIDENFITFDDTEIEKKKLPQKSDLYK